MPEKSFDLKKMYSILLNSINSYDDADSSSA